MTINNTLNSRGLVNASGGSITTSGGNALTLTTTGTTTVTLPTSGTLVNTTVTALPSLSTTGTLISATWNATPITAQYGGTGSTFVQFSGASTSIKTYTLPNSSATILTSASPVSVPQGGTGMVNGSSGGIPFFNSTTTMTSTAPFQAGGLILGGGAGVAPSTNASLNYSTTTGQLSMSASFPQPRLTISTTSSTVGHESAVFLNRSSVANGYTQVHFQAAGVEDWAVGTRLGSQNLTFWNNSASWAPFTFTKAPTKYEMIVSSNITGSINESAVTINRGDQANGFASLYFKTANSNNFILQTKSGSDDLTLYTAGTNQAAFRFGNSGNFTKPRSCALKYYIPSTEFSVTGDGTQYILKFTKQTCDYNNNYNGTTVTIPVNGFYSSKICLNLGNVDPINESMDLRFIVNGNPSDFDIFYVGSPITFTNSFSGNFFNQNFCLDSYYTAGTELQVQLTVYSNGGSNLVDFLAFSTFSLVLEG